MVELYFLIYRIPRMMIQLAGERNRSGLAWSLLAVGAWIGAEIIVAVALRLIYLTGVLLLGWPSPIAPLLNFTIYVVSLGAAIAGLMFVRRILYNKNRTGSFPLPPPPPSFASEDS